MRVIRWLVHEWVHGGVGYVIVVAIIGPIVGLVGALVMWLRMRFGYRPPEDEWHEVPH